MTMVIVTGNLIRYVYKRKMIKHNIKKIIHNENTTTHFYRRSFFYVFFC
jgi:hypothetical protein